MSVGGVVEVAADDDIVPGTSVTALAVTALDLSVENEDPVPCCWPMSLYMASMDGRRVSVTSLCAWSTAVAPPPPELDPDPDPAPDSMGGGEEACKGVGTLT